MKILYLLRHAKSSWKDPSLEDFDRPLNGRGRRAAQRMGRFLDDEGMHPAVVLCSGAKRTRETLDLIMMSLGEDLTIQVTPALYLATPKDILKEVARIDAAVPSVMVIGHNPGLEELAAQLAGSGDKETMKRMKDKFPTAALAMLTSDAERWTDLDDGSMHLETFVKPKELDGQ